MGTEADPYAEALRVFREVSPRTLILAGGSTPRPLYEELALVEHPWAETDVFFSDERCVPLDDTDSNYHMVYEALLSKIPARVHPMAGAACDADAHDSELRAFFGEQPVHFDLAFLGLGEEGHTASLFPGDPALDVADRLIVAVERPDHPRLTLTLPALSATDVAVFLVSRQGQGSGCEGVDRGAGYTRRACRSGAHHSSRRHRCSFAA